MAVRLLRALVIGLAGLTAVIGFVMGFIRIPHPEAASELGVVLGIASAGAWAAASASGSAMWNNWFNAFAAAFAALSLGYLTPAETFCGWDDAAAGQRWHASTRVFDTLCRMSAAHPMPSDPAIALLRLSIADVARDSIKAGELGRATAGTLEELRLALDASRQLTAERLDRLERAIAAMADKPPGKP